MQLEIGLKDKCQKPADSKCHSWDTVRDICDHPGFCSALKNLASHYFGMTMASIQVDQERIASAMAMADVAGIDLSTTPAVSAAKAHNDADEGAVATDPAVMDTVQCRDVLLFFKTSLNLLKVVAAARFGGLDEEGAAQHLSTVPASRVSALCSGLASLSAMFFEFV